MLDLEVASRDRPVEINARAIQARRRAGFQSAPVETDGFQRRREINRRRLSKTSGRTLFGSDMDQTV